MSANRIRICPVCLATSIKEEAEKRHDAEKAYGKVPPAEYADMIADAEKCSKVGEDLFENFEIFMDNSGVLNISYGCRCDKCGFYYGFEHKENALAKNQ